jgi:hypothetical protein
MLFERNACCSPAASVPEVARACAHRSESSQDRGRRRRGAERADRAGGVPEVVVRGIDDNADAGGELVARHHRSEEQFAAGMTILRGGQRRGDGRRARMIERVTVDVVEFDRVRGAAVDEGGVSAGACYGSAAAPAPSLTRARRRGALPRA